MHASVKQRLLRDVLPRIKVYGSILLLGLTLFAVVVVNPTFTAHGGPTASLVRPADLRRHVVALTSLPKPRQYENSDALNAAATYIEEQWRGMGASVDEQPYAVGSRTFKNLLVTLGQKDGDRIVVGAHYDVCGERPGADDNASGIAGLIELTRLLQLDGARLHHRVDLVAYSTEEPPYFATSAMGSAHHARLIKDQGVKISAMLSLEMLGFFSNEPGSQGFPLPLFSLFYPTKGNYIAVVGRVTDWALTRQMKSLMQSATALPVYSANSPRFIPGIDWSDQRGYWDLGYPAVMVTDTAFLRNPNYHETTDTIDTLDFDRMADVVTAVHAAVKDLR